MVFVPCNANGNHWTFFVTEIRRRAMIYCNSYHTHPSQQELIIYYSLCSLLHNDFGITDDWLLETPETNRQTDSYNCEVFVCWFATQIINGQNLLPIYLIHYFFGKSYMKLLWGTAYEDKSSQITTVYNVSKHQSKLAIRSSVINVNSGGTALVLVFPLLMLTNKHLYAK